MDWVISTRMCFAGPSKYINEKAYFGKLINWGTNDAENGTSVYYKCSLSVSLVRIFK